MVVIPASPKERGLCSVTLRDGEPQNIAVKVDGTLKIADLEVDVADAGVGVHCG
jgi:putative ubiquitin-RnfH superfamily antitoxin RatB of RatAB toxin-antitoxin module